MKKISLLLYISSALLTLSCIQPNNQRLMVNSNDATVTDTITIALNVKSVQSDNPYSHLVFSYLDVFGNQQEKRYTGEGNQIKLPIRDKRVIKLGSSIISYYEVLADKGDSLLIVEDTTKPLSMRVKIISTNTGKKERGYFTVSQFYTAFETAHPYYTKKYLALENRILERKFSNEIAFTIIRKEKNEQRFAETVNQIITANLAAYQAKKAFLDSLYQAKTIGADYYEWMGYKLKAYLLMIQQTYYGYIGKDWKPLIDEYGLQDERLIDAFYPDYREFLRNTLLPTVILGGKMINKTKTTRGYDWKKAYDSASLYCKGRSLWFLQLYCLQGMRAEEPTPVFKLYYNKFIQAVGDTVYINHAQNAFFSALTDSAAVKSLLTTAGRARTLTFKQLLAANKGKLVLLDFWASWCAPCRAAMPASEQLRQQFAGKNITFVYLSIDDDYGKWTNAAQDENIQYYPNSYLVMEPRQSRFLRELKISDIPRYVLYDKMGQVLLLNVPAPGSKELVDIINRNL